MSRERLSAADRSPSRTAGTLVGVALGVLLPLFFAEAYLRAFPVSDIQRFLGDASPLRGPFVSSAGFGIAYASWEGFEEQNRQALEDFGSWSVATDPRPIWAFVGNSFIQEPEMLGDAVADAAPERRVFVLRHIVPIQQRFAGIEQLLERGFVPERIFVGLMILDGGELGKQPLGTRHVGRLGALLCVPRAPPPLLRPLVAHTRVGLTAWVRAEQAEANPGLNRRHFTRRMDPSAAQDLHTLFAALRRLTREHGVETSVVLIPRESQIVDEKGFAFQDAVAPMLRSLGFDVIDPRDALLAESDRRALFASDHHMSPIGNRIMAEALLQRVGPGSPVPRERP